MFGFVAHVISSVTTILLPAYLSYKALRSRDPAQIHPWLIYFTILSLALLAESWTYFIISWVPFYSWIRLFFLLYLVLPQTQGAKVLYLEYLEPYIIHHEVQIDHFISEAHARLQQFGLGYFSTLTEFLRDKILGQQPPRYQQYQQQMPPRYQQQQQQQPSGASYASYAQDLLTRFAMPQARVQATGGPPASAAAARVSGLYGAFSGFAGAAIGGGAADSYGRSRDVTPTQSQESAGSPGIPQSLVPDISSGPGGSSHREKSARIAAERERLNGILKSLEKEQQSLDLAYGPPSAASAASSSSSSPSFSYDTSYAGGGVRPKKTHSEQSFERIDHDFHRSIPVDANAPQILPPSSSSSSSSSSPSYSTGYNTNRRGTSNPNPNNANNPSYRSASGGGSWVPAAVSGWLGDGSQQQVRGESRQDFAPPPGPPPQSSSSKGWSTARDITEAMNAQGQGQGVHDRRGR